MASRPATYFLSDCPNLGEAKACRSYDEMHKAELKAGAFMDFNGLTSCYIIRRDGNTFEDAIKAVVTI